MTELKAEGSLPPGWKVEVRVRKTGKKDRYYIDPDSGYTFRSLKDIDRYRSSGELGRHVKKTKPKDEGCSQGKLDALKSLVESTGKKTLVYDRSRKSRLVDLRRKLAGNAMRKEDVGAGNETRTEVVVAGNETRKEVVVAGNEASEEAAKAIDRKKKNITEAKIEKKREGPTTRSETRKQGTGGENVTEEEATGARNETKQEGIRCENESNMEVKGGRNETKREDTRGKSETKMVTAVGNETKKEGRTGNNERTMEITGERNETNDDDPLVKSFLKEAAGIRHKKKNGSLMGKSKTKEINEARNETKRKGSTSKNETRNEVSGAINETDKEGTTGKRDMKMEGIMQVKETMQGKELMKGKEPVQEKEPMEEKEIKKEVENKTKKGLIRARTETKKEFTPLSRKVKRKKLSEAQDMKPFFIHDPDEYRADLSLNLPGISEIMDTVQKAEDISGAPYISAPAIGQLLVRKASETQNQLSTANIQGNCIYASNFPPPPPRWLTNQELSLLPIEQVPVGASQLNVSESKSSDRNMHTGYNVSEIRTTTMVKVGNEAVENGSGLPLPSPDAGDVWLDPCIDFAIKTLTGADPAIDDYFQRQQQQNPRPVKPESINYSFQKQQQQSPAKSERVSYYFQQLQPSSSKNLEMVSYSYKANEQPRPICDVEELRFEDLAIDDKRKPNVSQSKPRLRY